MSVPPANRHHVFATRHDSNVYHKLWTRTGWSSWENLGGTTIFDPVAISWGPNRVDLFTIGSDMALYHKWWNGTSDSWLPSQTAYYRLGGVWSEKPVVTSWGPNRLDVFLVARNGALYHKFFRNGNWNEGFVHLGGTLLYEPCAVARSVGEISLFHTGTDGVVYHKWWDGSRWGPEGESGRWAAEDQTLVHTH